MNTLLKAATIVDVKNSNLHLKKRDILIKNGVIDTIAPTIDAPAKTQVITNKNLHVSIGWFDSSVCFGEPGFEERETVVNGLRTAAKSGYTDLVLNPCAHPVPDTSSHIVFLKNAAKNETTCLHPMGTLTMNAAGKDLAELYDMMNAGAVGFYDYKHAIANANLLKIALQYAQNFDALVCSFPIDVQIAGKGVVNEGEVSTKMGLKGIPALSEEIQIARDLSILAYTGGKLHIPTISTAQSVKLIADAKKKGLDVSCSVAIHNLYFTDAHLEEYDTNFKVMPPLRTKKDTKALQKALLQGVIDFVTTDHTPMNIEEKRVEFDNAAYGSIGLESAFGILNGLFDVEKAVEILTRGRERYKIATPSIKEGEKACLTLFDPTLNYIFDEKSILSTSKNSMFVQQKMKGKALGVIANRQIQYTE